VAPLNLTELAQIAVDLQALVGSQLQDCVQSESEIGLGFYHDRQMVWLWFDLHPQRPLLLKLSDPPLRKKLQRPLTLFLKSRFTGRRLASVRADLARGRVMLFGFHRSQDEKESAPPILEVRLIPHAANLIAVDGKAKVAEQKPKDLPVQPMMEREEPIVRTWAQITDEWLQAQKTKSQAKGQAPTDASVREKKFQKAVEKKRQALERMRDELNFKTSSAYRDLGEWLKANGTLEGAPHGDLLNRDESLSWNIEHAFHRAKENERKADGTRARIAQVTGELAELQRAGAGHFDLPRKGPGAKERESLLAKAAARGRRHSVASDLDVYIGKSASDNLAILRKAQPFDLWLHLRDFPGSHAILRRTRGRNVTDSELREAGRWVIEQSLGARAAQMKGERFDMLIVECRYVRPIKGDKLGRVNYTNDRVMSLRYER
jgi:predicted ribosome quality control (RQC) complex YloA/Tae2 family protein